MIEEGFKKWLGKQHAWFRCVCGMAPKQLGQTDNIQLLHAMCVDYLILLCFPALFSTKKAGLSKTN